MPGRPSTANCGETVHVREMDADSGALCRRFLRPSYPHYKIETDAARGMKAQDIDG